LVFFYSACTLSCTNAYSNWNVVMNWIRQRKRHPLNNYGMLKSSFDFFFTLFFLCHGPFYSPGQSGIWFDCKPPTNYWPRFFIARLGSLLIATVALNSHAIDKLKMEVRKKENNWENPPFANRFKALCKKAKRSKVSIWASRQTFVTNIWLCPHFVIFIWAK